MNEAQLKARLHQALMEGHMGKTDCEATFGKDFAGRPEYWNASPLTFKVNAQDIAEIPPERRDEILREVLQAHIPQPLSDNDTFIYEDGKSGKVHFNVKEHRANLYYDIYQAASEVEGIASHSATPLQTAARIVAQQGTEFLEERPTKYPEHFEPGAFKTFDALMEAAHHLRYGNKPDTLPQGVQETLLERNAIGNLRTDCRVCLMVGMAVKYSWEMHFRCLEKAWQSWSADTSCPRMGLSVRTQ